jgi:hypothetical protein
MSSQRTDHHFRPRESGSPSERCELITKHGNEGFSTQLLAGQAGPSKTEKVTAQVFEIRFRDVVQCQEILHLGSQEASSPDADLLEICAEQGVPVDTLIHTGDQPRKERDQLWKGLLEASAGGLKTYDHFLIRFLWQRWIDMNRHNCYVDYTKIIDISIMLSWGYRLTDSGDSAMIYR